MYRNNINYHGTILESLFPSFVQSLPKQRGPYRERTETSILSGPATPHPSYSVMFDRWEPIVHLNGGTLAIREAGTKYLPQEEGEEKTIYLNRLARSVLFGAYSRTIKTLSAMPFMTPMTVTNLPPELEYLLQNCTGDSQSITVFGKKILEDMINHGVAHILVEYPMVEEGEELSLADEDILNIKPYFSRIDPLRLVSWDYETVGCQQVLKEVRIFEDVLEQDPENVWAKKHKKKVRVITPGEVNLYSLEGDNNNLNYVLENTIETDMQKMNIVTIYGNRTGFMQGSPCLEELAWLNIRHWQKLSDLDNIEHIVNVPMAYALGLQDGEMENVVFSPHTMIKSGNSEVKLGYLEHSGSAIPASQSSIKDLENRMVAMGAEALAPRGTSTRETASAKTIDNTKSTSLLQELVESLEYGLQKCFALAGEWLGIDASQVKVNIGDKISLTVDANLITNLIDLARQNNMEFSDLANELKRRGMLLDSTELKAGAMEQENPSNLNLDDENL